MIVVSYNPDLSRFVFESESWETIDTDLFLQSGITIEEIQPACQSDSSIGYVSDGITAYVVTATTAQIEEVCEKLEVLAEVNKQLVLGSNDTLFEDVVFFG